LLGAGSDPESYELHFCLKDYCFGRADRMVGITVLQLRDLADSQRGASGNASGACACLCVFGKKLNLDDTGWTILRILSQRPQDEVAKEFVRLKSEVRSQDDSNQAGASHGPPKSALNRPTPQQPVRSNGLERTVIQRRSNR
ncbi:hypothetical protein Ciccas_006824, partial [Cichlidogyrus casuarinus]